MLKTVIKKILNFFKVRLPLIYSAAGSFLLSVGWNWYLTPHHPRRHWLFAVVVAWAAVFVGYWVLKRLYRYLMVRYGRHFFWQDKFYRAWDELFFIFSFVFLIFFFKNELVSFAYVSAVFAFFYWRFNAYFSFHPNSLGWRTVNHSLFLFAYFIFFLCGLLQYTAYHYFILDTAAHTGVVVFRAWCMSMFWLLGFAVSGVIFCRLRGLWRFIVLSVWSLLFFLALVVWTFNVGVLYFSGLYVGPMFLQHMEGGGQVAENKVVLILILLLIVSVALFVRVLKYLVRAYRIGPRRYWYFYNTLIIFTALASLFSLSAFRHTPEFTIAKTFYDFLFGNNVGIKLDPIVQAKLERFGLKYQTDQFKVAHKEKVFDKPMTLLPAKFQSTRPNIVMVFFESFSSKLNSVYNSRFPGLTPGLERMASDKNTTVFKNYYNGSTPTITGLMAQLCSVYPPTGQNEINFQNLFKDHRLLCLPKILRENGGYQYANHITAVPKTYSHKDLIYTRMGMDEVFGQDELAKYIEGEPLSWGYSDNQMFPVLEKFMKEKPQPFLMSLSTVDVHTPFTMTKDAVPYSNLKSPLLDSVHSSDNAFGKFWDNFVKSEFYDNTIVIAVADHAIFPVSYPKELFPELADGSATYYDEITFMMYVPDTILPSTVNTFSSSVDFTPTLLQMLNLNVPNSFEGHSIFSERQAFPNLVGLQEFGLYINEQLPSGKRVASYDLFSRLDCAPGDFTNSTSSPLTLCEFKNYYDWKKQMFSAGRFWEF